MTVADGSPEGHAIWPACTLGGLSDAPDRTLCSNLETTCTAALFASSGQTYLLLHVLQVQPHLLFFPVSQLADWQEQPGPRPTSCQVPSLGL